MTGCLGTKVESQARGPCWSPAAADMCPRTRGRTRLYRAAGNTTLRHPGLPSCGASRHSARSEGFSDNRPAQHPAGSSKVRDLDRAASGADVPGEITSQRTRAMPLVDATLCAPPSSVWSGWGYLDRHALSPPRLDGPSDLGTCIARATKKQRQRRKPGFWKPWTKPVPC